MVNERKPKQSLEDFNLLSKLGEGSYGKVYKAEEKSTGKVFALKQINKAFVTEEGKEYQVFIEKIILQQIQSDNIIKLYSTFQDKNNLYFLTEFLSGGDLGKFMLRFSELNRKDFNKGGPIHSYRSDLNARVNLEIWCHS